MDSDPGTADAGWRAADSPAGEVNGTGRFASHGGGAYPARGFTTGNGQSAPELSSWERDAAVSQGAGRSGRPEVAISVLANRIAAALVHHEPGWPLPRMSALARQYNAASELLAGAISALATRGLIRRMPDGQYCRASPAHYVLPFDGSLPGLRVRADPVGGDLVVKSHSISVHPVRDDIGRVLQIARDDPAWILQLSWAVGGQAAAATSTYVVPRLGPSLIGEIDFAQPGPVCSILPLTAGEAGTRAPAAAGWLVPTAFDAGLQQPPRWAAHSLGLTACQSAVMLAIRYGDMRDGKPAALTIGALCPQFFRVAIASSDRPVITGETGGVPAGWSNVTWDWEF